MKLPHWVHKQLLCLGVQEIIELRLKEIILEFYLTMKSWLRIYGKECKVSLQKKFMDGFHVLLLKNFDSISTMLARCLNLTL